MVRFSEKSEKEHTNRHGVLVSIFCLQKFPMGIPSAKPFLAGIRTPEGRVKADNDNHYITRNSCLSFRSTAIQPVLTGVGGKLVPILVDAAIINTRTIFGARHFDVFIRMDV